MPVKAPFTVADHICSTKAVVKKWTLVLLFSSCASVGIDAPAPPTNHLLASPLPCNPFVLECKVAILPF